MLTIRPASTSTTCTNYFRHPSGKVVTQLPYSGKTFFERTRAMVEDDYELGS